MNLNIGGITVYGSDMDEAGRCLHYHEANDIIAIRFYCCNAWFCCYQCHKELCSHSPRQWPSHTFDQKSVLCGECGTVLTIQEYLDSGYECPACRSSFNPGCRYHYPLYFEAFPD